MSNFCLKQMSAQEVKWLDRDNKYHHSVHWKILKDFCKQNIY